MRHALIGLLTFLILLGAMVAYAALPVSDGFTAADGTNFASYSANWTVVAEAGVIWGNAVGANSGNPTFMAKDNSNTYTGNQIATGIIKNPVDGTYAGVALNMTTGLNGYECRADANELQLRRRGTTLTIWSATTPTVSDGDELRAWRDGNDLYCQLWRGGSKIYDSGAQTDTTHMAGSPGISGFGVVSSTSYTRIDDVTLNNYSASSPTPMRSRLIMMFFTLPELP